jgi:hypothetical protein
MQRVGSISRSNGVAMMQWSGSEEIPGKRAKSKYWRNNLVEFGPFLSGFLDKFASFEVGLSDQCLQPSFV